MSDTLRSKVIRLAHQNPDLRPHLIPLVTKTAAVDADSFYGAEKALTVLLGKTIHSVLQAEFGGEINLRAPKIVPTVHATRLEIVGLFADDPTGNDYIWVDVDTAHDYTVKYTFERGGKNVGVEVPLKHFNNYWSHVSVPKLGTDIAKFVVKKLREYLAGR